MTETTRKYKSEIHIAQHLKIEPVPPKKGKHEDKGSLSKTNPPQIFDSDLILGIIERIKKI
ncbi:MAG: hypothetical protein MUO62_03245 [Anaerolineales bacterium]|nr:hypothetical protein [Anaerolineales bacterium]